MSLQGSLDTFALPDVLVLLASTRKSGELRVAGSTSGRVWVDGGSLVGHDVAGTTDPARAVFELLRLDTGTFTFDSGLAAPSPYAQRDIEPVLQEAQARLAEWRDVVAVVPSLTARVQMATEAPADRVTVRSDQWRILVEVAAGRPVQAVRDLLGVDELDAMKAVKDLVEAGLATVTAAPEPPAAPAPAPEPDVKAAVPEPEAPAPQRRPDPEPEPERRREPARSESRPEPKPEAKPEPRPEPEAAAERAPSRPEPSRQDRPESRPEPARQDRPAAVKVDTTVAPDELVSIPARGRRPRPEDEQGAAAATAAPTAPAATPTPAPAAAPASAPAPAPATAETTSMSRVAAARSFGDLAGGNGGGTSTMAPPEEPDAAVPAVPDAAEAVEGGTAPEGEAEVGEDGEPINRGLLLKFLSSVRQ